MHKYRFAERPVFDPGHIGSSTGTPDRPKLEARVCECYATVKKEYARLLS